MNNHKNSGRKSDNHRAFNGRLRGGPSVGSSAVGSAVGSGVGSTSDRQRAPANLLSLKNLASDADAALSINTRLKLQETFRFDSHLAQRLIRREVNVKEAFTICDESGSFFRSSLKELHGGGVGGGGVALPYEQMQRSPEPTLEITLACSVLARQRMIFVMQKATELGVSSIVPLLTEHSVPVEGLEHEKASAWPNQIIRAAKQCRRSSLPQLCSPMSLNEFIGSPGFKSADVRIMFDDRALPTALPTEPPREEAPRRIVLFIGPEGGFSDPERAKLAIDCRPWMLGGRILRAETAVLVGLTAVQLRWGDFQ